MKVNVNGYGLLPFRATECYKFRGDESLVQFRGEVKLPKGVRAGGGKKWIQHDYWYDPTQIGVTYGTSPSEADAEKLKSMITALECNGESCNNPNCDCKKGSITPPLTEYDKTLAKEFNNIMIYGNQAEGLYKPTELGENLITTNHSSPTSSENAVDESIKELKIGEYYVINIKEKPADMTWAEFFEGIKLGAITLGKKEGIRQVGTLDDIDKDVYKIYFTADGGKSYYRTTVCKHLVDKDIHSISSTNLVTDQCELDMLALWERHAVRSEDEKLEDYSEAIAVDVRHKPDGVSWGDFIKNLDSAPTRESNETYGDIDLERKLFNLKAIRDAKEVMSKLDLSDPKELRHYSDLLDIIHKINRN